MSSESVQGRYRHPDDFKKQEQIGMPCIAVVMTLFVAGVAVAAYFRNPTFHMWAQNHVITPIHSWTQNHVITPIVDHKKLVFNLLETVGPVAGVSGASGLAMIVCVEKAPEIAFAITVTVIGCLVSGLPRLRVPCKRKADPVPSTE